MSDTIEVGSEVLEDQEIKEPDSYQVILLNDDITTMAYVIDLLCRLFNKDLETAQALTQRIHTTGRGICGIYTEEIAETKVRMVHKDARAAGYPLRCIMEKV